MNATGVRVESVAWMTRLGCILILVIHPDPRDGSRRPHNPIPSLSYELLNVLGPVGRTSASIFIGLPPRG